MGGGERGKEFYIVLLCILWNSRSHVISLAITHFYTSKQQRSCPNIPAVRWSLFRDKLVNRGSKKFLLGKFLQALENPRREEKKEDEERTEKEEKTIRNELKA